MTLPMDLDARPDVGKAALNATAVTTMLRRHYQPEGKPPAGVFAPEIQSPCGNRRADLIWMPTTIAGGKGELHGHEIKCSRADLLAELADPAKADPWGQYCTRWWLVVSRPDLVDGLDIPEPWGILAPPSGRRTRTMTVLRPAPKLTPANAAPGMARLAAWQLYGHHAEVVDLRGKLEHAERDLEYQRKRVRELELGGARKPSATALRVQSIVDLVQQQLRAETRIYYDKVPDEVVAAAIVDHVATRAAAQQMRWDLDSIARAVETLTRPFANSARTTADAGRLGTVAARGDDERAALDAILAALPGTEVVV